MGAGQILLRRGASFGSGVWVLGSPSQHAWSSSARPRSGVPLRACVPLSSKPQTSTTKPFAGVSQIQNRFRDMAEGRTPAPEKVPCVVCRVQCLRFSFSRLIFFLSSIIFLVGYHVSQLSIIYCIVIICYGATTAENRRRPYRHMVHSLGLRVES